MLVEVVDVVVVDVDVAVVDGVVDVLIDVLPVYDEVLPLAVLVSTPIDGVEMPDTVLPVAEPELLTDVLAIPVAEAELAVDVDDGGDRFDEVPVDAALDVAPETVECDTVDGGVE